jgi:C-terminal processing protease CtpA/Prc
VARTPGVTERRLTGNVGYVAINNFEQDSIVPWFDAAMARLGGVRALIIDVRHNGGGNSDPGNQIVRRLSTRVSLTAEAWTRAYLPAIRAWGMGVGRHWFAPDTLAPHPDIHYGMPVALLVGPATFSAAEDFTVAFRQMGRGFFALPGGGSARVRTKHDRFADGTEFTGVGIQPDILVRPTVAGVRAGRDEVLEAAVKALTR